MTFSTLQLSSKMSRWKQIPSMAGVLPVRNPPQLCGAEVTGQACSWVRTQTAPSFSPALPHRPHGLYLPSLPTSCQVLVLVPVLNSLIWLGGGGRMLLASSGE